METSEPILWIATLSIIMIFFTNIGLSIVFASIERASDFGDQAVGPGLKSEVAALHLMNHNDADEFGEFESSKLESVTDDCGRGSIQGIEDDSNIEIEVATEENSCDMDGQLQAEIILGVENKSGGDSNPEKIKIRGR